MTPKIATYILLALSFIGLGVAMAKHGEERPPHNFWITLISTLIEWWLFYEAGLFTNL